MLENNTENEWTLLDVEELCQRLSISETTAYKLLRKNEIKGFRTCDGIGPWKIPIAALNSYIRNKCGLEANK